MKKFERKFDHNEIEKKPENNQEKEPKPDKKSGFHAMKTQKKDIYKDYVPQKSLEVFIENDPEPIFYDETFTAEDFKKITKKWKDENL